MAKLINFLDILAESQLAKVNFLRDPRKLMREARLSEPQIKAVLSKKSEKIAAEVKKEIEKIHKSLKSSLSGKTW